MMVINSENFDKVLECFDEVFKGWIPALKNNEPYGGHKLGTIMRDDIPHYFEELEFIDDENYTVDGSAGVGQWASVPWVAILNNKIMSAASEEGYDIVYLFCEDMRGMYLSLNFGAEAFKNRYRQGRGRRNPYKEKLKQSAEIFRNTLKEEYSIISDYDAMDLGTNNLERESHAEEYEAGDIYSIFYSKEYLKDIAEEELLGDLKLFLEYLDYLYEKMGKKVFFDEEVGESRGTHEIGSNEGGSDLVEEKTFYQELKEQGLYYDKKTVENYLLSLKVKPFVILTGPSGTGKTKIAKEFAEYIRVNFPELKGSNNGSYYTTRNKAPKTSYNDKSRNDFEISELNFEGDCYPLSDYFGDCDLVVKGKPFKFSAQFKPRIVLRDEKLLNYLKNKYDGGTYSLKINSNDFDKCMIKDYIRKEQNLTANIACSNLTGVKKKNGDVGRFEVPKTISHWQVSDFIPFKDGPCDIIVDNQHFDVEIEMVIRFKLKNKNDLSELEELLKDDYKVDISIDTSTFEYVKSAQKDDFSQIGEIVSDGFYKSNEDDEIYSKMENYKIVPVGANWTENRNIVGFYNVLTESYQTTPSLELLLKSEKIQDYPYFLILDEMNLSHVERYFSDFLSAMESEKPIPLHNAGPGVGSVNIENIPEEVEISENLFIVGTVNVDETTYMFSPKVLDRANTIEIEAFRDITIEQYLKEEAYDDEDFKGDKNYLIDPLSDSELKDKKIHDLSEELKAIPNGSDVWESLTDDLSEINDCLKPAGFEFGFRVVNEIIKFMVVSKNYEMDNIKADGWKNWQRYFDAQIKQKILPKLHGSHQTLDKPLRELFKICLNEPSDVIPKIEDFNDEDAKYPESAKKLIQMINTLENQMYVSFIN